MTRLENYELILNTILKGSLTSEYVLDPDVLRKMLRKDQAIKNLNGGLTNDILQALHKTLMEDPPGKRENEELKKSGIEVYYKTLHFVTEKDFNYILPMLVNMIETEKSLTNQYHTLYARKPEEDRDELQNLPGITIDELKDGLRIAKQGGSEGTDYCIFTGYSLEDDNKTPKKIAFKIKRNLQDFSNEFICLNPIID